MQSAILQSDSGNDLKLILQLARKPGISTRELSEEKIEDFGLSAAIMQGRIGEFIDTGVF